MYYDIEYDHDLLGFQCKSPDECEKMADEWFSEQWDDEPMKNGETRVGDAWIVGFDDDGEEFMREPIVLLYEYYHGDFKEHNTLGM